VELSSYTPNPLSQLSDLPNWSEDVYLATCGAYPPQLLAASAGSGIFVSLFAGNAYSDSPFQTQYSGHNPYLFILDTTGGILYSSSLPDDGYSSSIAEDGTNVYLALPQSDEVQSVSLPAQTVTTYDVGFPASHLLWSNGTLFAISANEVKVYSSGMDLLKTISFGSLSLASFSNAFTAEATLHSPSFIALNSTSYAALLENSTGYATMVIGKYG
jgi:hypothetical protein